MSESKLPDELIEAYRQAEYRVGDGADAFCLKVGVRSMELEKLFRDRGVSSAAFVTAFNPFGRKRPAAENEASHAELVGVLDARSAAWLSAVSRAPDGSHPEKGVLVLGLQREEAKWIGERFQQNAIVCAAEDATPELVLLR